MSRIIKKVAWIIFLSLFAWELIGQAATYNFYFNNTEQGDNSTATPNVVIGNGEKEGGKSIDAQGAVAEKVPPASRPPVASAPLEAAQSSARLPADAVAEPEFRHFRVAAGVVDLLGAMGGTVNVGYFFNREFGFNAYGGAEESDFTGGVQHGIAGVEDSTHYFAGIEMEVTPVRISVGRIDDLIDLGGMLGVSTVGRDDDNWVSPHIGARMNINLGSRWGLTTTARLNATYAMAEIGVAFRF